MSEEKEIMDYEAHNAKVALDLVKEKAKNEHLREQLRMVELKILQYKFAEGCSCCRDNEEHERHENELGKLFGWPRYDDDSGYDWYSQRDKLLEKDK